MWVKTTGHALACIDVTSTSGVDVVPAFQSSQGLSRRLALKDEPSVCTMCSTKAKGATGSVATTCCWSVKLWPSRE